MMFWMISLAPLLVLVGLAVIASLLGFGLLQLTGDILPLAKVISKLTLIMLLLSMFPLRKVLSLSWQDLGFAAPRIFFRQMGQGLLLGVATLLPVLLTLYWLNVHVWDQAHTWTVAKLIQKTALALFVALLIAVGEEIVFRGLLLSVLRRKLSLVAAITVSSLYYAALHFLKTKTNIPVDQQTITSGFKLMLEAFGHWFNPNIMSALIALFVVGSFLALLRSRVSQSLGLCIGCHAGWVWQIKLSKDLCDVNPASDYLYLVSSYDGVVGPLVSVWLTAAIVAWLLVAGKLKNSVLN